MPAPEPPDADDVPELHRQLSNPAGAVYGTIVAAGVLAAEGDGGHSIGAVVASIVGTLAVFWLAHAYTDMLGEQIESRAFAPGRFWHALVVEAPILESAVAPVLALLAAAAFGATRTTAVTSALVVAVLELLGWTVIASRRLGLRPGQAIPYCVATTVLGFGIIGLKVLIH